MTDYCPDCGSGEACERCQFAIRLYKHLADPHKAVGFLDGDVPCSVSGRFIEEHALIDGASACQRADA